MPEGTYTIRKLVYFSRKPVTDRHTYIQAQPQNIIAERLSVRHIIVRARRALMGPYSEVVFVCMSVRNGFTTEVYEFTYSVSTLRHVPVLVR